jgi:methylaspartate mutase epsilon subunit
MENGRWSDERFAQERVKVAAGFPRGKEINLVESTEYLSGMPIHRNCSYKIRTAHERGLTLLQTGMAGDIMAADPESATLESLRRLSEELDMPLQGSVTGPEAKIRCELLCASGWTSISGGGISYDASFEGDYTLEQSLVDWRYCDRLVSFYDECGIPVNRETSVPPAGILVPPSISNAVSILEMLLAAEQGVKDITLAQRQYGNLIQDAAAMLGMLEQAEEYLQLYGKKNVRLSACMHQMDSEFSGGDQLQAAGAAYGVMTAALAGADKVAVEWSGIDEAKQLLNMLCGQRLPLSKEVETEIAIIKAETKCIVSRVLEAGDGNVAAGVLKAFREGTLDLPNGPGSCCLGELTAGRDRLGAVRYLNPGKVPLSEELKRFNRRKLHERDEIERGKDA